MPHRSSALPAPIVRACWSIPLAVLVSDWTSRSSVDFAITRRARVGARQPSISCAKHSGHHQPSVCLQELPSLREAQAGESQETEFLAPGRLAVAQQFGTLN